MALTAKILNPGATLNSFKEISAIDFIPGTALTINLRLFDTNENLRRVPPSGSTLDVLFDKTDGTQLTKAASLNVDDRSIATVSLTASETEDLVGGTIDLELTEGAVLIKGMIINGLQNAAGC